ncbi:MAG: hypothetical protein ACE5J9_03590 [Methanosarcinales archaeon]
MVKKDIIYVEPTEKERKILIRLINGKASQSELGSISGMKPATLSIKLGRWRNLGIVNFFYAGKDKMVELNKRKIKTEKTIFGKYSIPAFLGLLISSIMSMIISLYTLEMSYLVGTLITVLCTIISYFIYIIFNPQYSKILIPEKIRKEEKSTWKKI